MNFFQLPRVGVSVTNLTLKKGLYEVCWGSRWDKAGGALVASNVALNCAAEDINFGANAAGTSDTNKVILNLSGVVTVTGSIDGHWFTFRLID